MGIENHLERLNRPPSHELREEEKVAVLDLERQLTQGIDLRANLQTTLLTPRGREQPPVKGIERVWEIKVNTYNYFPDYFLTSDGRNSLEQALGRSIDEFVDANEVSRFLFNINYSQLSLEQNAALKSLQASSSEYAENILVQAFVDSGYNPDIQLPNLERITITRDPEALLDKLGQMRNLKQFLKDCRQGIDLDMISPAQANATRTILDIHQRKLNEMLSGAVVAARAYLNDHQRYFAGDSDNIANQLAEQAGINNDDGEFDQTRQRSFAQFDIFRQGAGDRDTEGDNTAIGQEAIDDVINSSNGNVDAVENARYRDIAETVFIEAEEWVTWAKKVLREYGLLSEEGDYDSDRPGRAKDDLWQVVVDPKVVSLNVSSRLGAVQIPARFRRRLGSILPNGAAPILDHELAHVIQNENKMRLGLSIFNMVGTDRAVANFEAGAIAWEREAHSVLFGNVRGVNTFYLEGMRAKIAGGDWQTVMKAMYANMLTANPNRDPRELAALAVNRSRRLFNHGGDVNDTSKYLTDSKDLVYLEQELIARKLHEYGMQHLLLVGGVNLSTLADLYEAGMLDMEKLFLPTRRPTEIIDDELQAKLN